MSIRVIGVPFNSAGRAGGVAAAPAALRAAGLVRGLVERLGPGAVLDVGDVEVGRLRPERSRRSGLLTEDALVRTVRSTREAVAAAHAAGDIPLVLGGDCPVMLGGLAATRDRYGSVALLMVDGHQDNYPPHRSPSGEAADSELYLALGLPSEGLPDALRAELPLLAPRQVQLLGPRDDALLARDSVASLRGTVPMYSDVEVVVRGPRAVARQAAEGVRAAAPAWWLHVDLDVLASEALGAVDYPQPGGLTWEQLADVTDAALAVSGCTGWTVAIYNPDLDPDGAGARRIAAYVGQMADRLGRVVLPSEPLKSSPDVDAGR